MSKKYRKLLLIPVILLVLVVGFFVLRMLLDRFHPAVRKLPKSAQNVRIYNAHPPRDIFFIVKAQMDEKAFEDYVSSLGFIRIKERLKENLHWTHIDVEWWDPTYDKENTYIDPNYRYSYGAMLKYENGYAYYMETTLLGWR